MKLLSRKSLSPTGEPLWRCSRCKANLPRSAYARNARSPAVNCYCKPCVRARLHEPSPMDPIEDAYLAALDEMHAFATAHNRTFRELMIEAIKNHIATSFGVPPSGGVVESAESAVAKKSADEVPA